MMLKRKHLQNFMTFYFEVLPKVHTQEKEREMLGQKHRVYRRVDKTR